MPDEAGPRKTGGGRRRRRPAAESTARPRPGAPGPVVIGEDVLPNIGDLAVPAPAAAPAPPAEQVPPRPKGPPPMPAVLEPPPAGHSVLIAIGPSQLGGVPARYDDG